MADCKIDRGIDKECDAPEIPGGVAELKIIDKSYYDEASETLDSSGNITSFALLSGEKFWDIAFEDDNQTRIDDPSTAKSAGVVFRDITGTVSVQDTASNRQFIDLLSRTRIVILSKNSASQWFLTGTRGKGLNFEQVTQSTTGGASTDSTNQIFTLKGQEILKYGRRRVWVDAPVWDVSATYGVGDYVKKLVSGSYVYYISLTAGNTGNDPVGSPANWEERTQTEVRDKLTAVLIASLVNP